MTSRPLRFLALALGGWVCIRAALLVPDAWSGTAPEPSANVPRPRPAPPRRAIASAERTTDAWPARRPPAASRRAISVLGSGVWAATAAEAVQEMVRPEQISLSRSTAVPAAGLAPSGGLSSPSALAAPAPPRRGNVSWTVSAWLLIRREGGSGLAPGGTLAGSQAGARLSYRLGGGVSLSARAYAPLQRPAGAEVAAGVAWRPAAAIPVDLLAERRQALGREGRSAFSIAAQGGGSLALPGGLRLDAYAQAGIVGLRSRDAFVDGAARVTAPVGPVEIGAAAWGGAQPGLSRLDAGPTLSWRLPVRGATLRVAADWRFRIAGDAAPGSGPALTLAADF